MIASVHALNRDIEYKEMCLTENLADCDGAIADPVRASYEEYHAHFGEACEGMAYMFSASVMRLMDKHKKLLQY